MMNDFISASFFKTHLLSIWFFNLKSSARKKFQVSWWPYRGDISIFLHKEVSCWLLEVISGGSESAEYFYDR